MLIDAYSCQHSHSTRYLVTLNSKMVLQHFKLDSTDQLCHHVCQNILRQTILQKHFTSFDLLTHKMVANVDVFCPLVELRILV